MTKSKIFFYFCLSFIGGIFLSSFLPQRDIFSSRIILYVGLILGILLVSALWQCKKIVVAGFSVLFLVLGLWRYQAAELQITNSELRKFNDSNQNIALTGIVAEEPDIRDKITRLIIKIENLGKILITTNRYPEYKYGDKLKTKGQLKTPSEDIDGFNYKNYLKKDGIHSVMDWPEVELVGSNFGNPIMKTLISLKNKFKETARSFISPPQEGILEALIFGEEGNISKEWKDKLNFTGTRHIVAVSGMNITIITFLISSCLLSLGFWRNQAFYITLFLLFLYILMIGFPASAARAGIMATLFLTAQHFGRLSSASRLLFFAAALMLFLNPFLLRLDVGFQLSFLAIMGIIYLQPTFSDWFSKIPNPGALPLRATLATTISAQVFTLPILVYNFGYIPLISPLTNILIVPFLAPFTILIFIFGLSAILFWPLGSLLSFPAWLSLTYIVKIISYFSKFPFVSLTFRNLHWIWLIIFYFLLGFIIWRLREREKLKFLKY